MAEKLTWFLTSIQTFSQALVMRLTVRTMSASSSLGAANVFGDHAVETRIIVSGEGEHLSTDGTLWKFFLVHCLVNSIKEVRSISFAVEDSIVKVTSDVIFPRKNLCGFQLLVVWVKADMVAVHLVQTSMHVNFVVEERPRVLLHTSNYAGKSSFAKSEHRVDLSNFCCDGTNQVIDLAHPVAFLFLLTIPWAGHTCMDRRKVQGFKKI